MAGMAGNDRERDAAGDGGAGDGIAVVVVTHESASTIDDCLARLRAAEGVLAIRVVDNASGDDTVAIVQRHAAADVRLRIPMQPSLRSINVAVACAMAVGEALRQTNGFPGASRL